MIIPVNFTSVNSQSALTPGPYEWRVDVYMNADLTACVHSFRLSGDLSQRISCIDLFITLKSGLSYAADFLRLKNGRWRDCHGLHADTIEELMPVELATSKIIFQYEMNDFIVELQ